MNKKLLGTLVVLMIAVLLAFSAFAADQRTVYVATDATGTGETAENAVSSLKKAIALLDGKGGEIVLCNSVFVQTDIVIPEQEGDLTITAQGFGKLVFSGSTITFEKNTNANVITLDVPLKMGSKGAVLFGGFNSVVFTENFSVDGTLDFYGGIDTPEALSSNVTYLVSNITSNKATVTELPYSITVNGGTFRTFVGGSYRDFANMHIGSIAAPIEIVINAGTFGEAVSFAADSALKNDTAFSISGQSILADDATLTINGGIFHAPIYAQGYVGEANSRASGSSQYVNSDRKFYAIDGEIEITLNGGTFNGCEINAFQNTAGLTQLLRGNYTLTIADGAVLADGIVLDATQVKAYNGVTDKKATLNYTGDATVVRFDVVNGEAQTYNEPLRIACVGDSITQGSGSTYTTTYPAEYPGSVARPAETHSYPAQLLGMIFDAGNTDVILGNYGHGGAKVMDYAGLYYNDLFFYTLSMYECDADYYIIGLGTNDAKATTYSYGMWERFYNDYTALICGYEALPDSDMVFGTSAIFRVGSDVPAVSNIRALQERVLTEQQANGKEVTYVDLYALTLEDALTGKLLSSDKLHPHADGYTTYAKAIYDAVFNGKIAVENFEMTDLYVSANGTENTDCTAENPTNNIAIAFAKAAPEATIHIIGTYDYTKMEHANYGFATPMNVNKITIKGEGEDAALTLNSKHLYIKTDAVFDNIRVATTLSGALQIACGYNNVTFTETFQCSDALFAAGVVVLSEDRKEGYYNSRESISSAEDCVITVNGGEFNYFVCGNYLFGGYKPAIYGTYSGNMTVNIGPNTVINAQAVNGASGQNYLTGTVTLNAAAWTEGRIIRPYGYIGSVTEEYDVSNNTGTVTINVLEPCTAAAYQIGDLDADGSVDVADVLTMVDYVLNGVPANIKNSASPYYYGISDVNLDDVMHMLYLATR